MEARPVRIHPLALAVLHAEVAEDDYRDSVTAWGPAEMARLRPLEEARILARKAWREAGRPVEGCAHGGEWFLDDHGGTVYFCKGCRAEVPPEMVEAARLEGELGAMIRGFEVVGPQSISEERALLIQVLRRAKRAIQLGS